MKSIFVNNTPFLEAIINTDDEKDSTDEWSSLSPLSSSSSSMDLDL